MSAWLHKNLFICELTKFCKSCIFPDCFVHNSSNGENDLVTYTAK